MILSEFRKEYLGEQNLDRRHTHGVSMSTHGPVGCKLRGLLDEHMLVAANSLDKEASIADEIDISGNH